MTAFPESVGPFKVDSEIGSGSCGRVFKAFDQRLSRWVAIKLLYAYQEQNIQQEARLLASISHPNIVSVFDIIEDDEQQWTALVMEYLPGDTLQNVLDNGQIINVEKALGYCIEIAKGLSAAHQLGIIHRDLKPENIFLDSHGHLKIGDFGIANMHGEKDPNAMLGSLNALSPEQVLGKELSPQSDLFSLGLLLYQMLQGRHPFEQDDGAEQMLSRLVNDDYPPINCEAEEVSNLVAGLLAKSPSERCSSAQEVVDKIRRILDVNFNHLAKPTLKQNNPVVAKFRTAQKKKHKQWLGAMLIIVLITGSILWSNFWPAKPRYIVVLKPVIESGEMLEDIMLVQTAVFQAATEAINEVSGNLLVSTGEIDDLSGTTDDVAKILNITAANEVLFTKLNCLPNQCAVTFSRWNGQPATLISQHSIQVPIDKLLFVADYVQNYLSGIFGDNANGSQAERPISEANYRQFLLVEHNYRQGNLTFAEMITELEILNEWRCDFEALCQLLLRSYLKKYRFEHNLEWLQRAKRLINAANQGSSKLFLLSAAIEVALIERDYPKADQLLMQLEQEHLTDDTVMSLRARWYFDQGYNVKGKSLMAKLVAQRPSVQHQYNFALMLFRLDQIEQSLIILEELLNKVPDYIKAMELRAVILFFDGQWHEVIDAYKQLITLDQGENSHTQSNIGLAYLMVKETETALDYFQRSVDIAPNNPIMLLNLADAQVLSGAVTSANSNYLKIIELVSPLNEKTIDDYLILAQAYARLKQNDRAVETLLNVLKTNSQNRFVLYNIGLIYLLVDDFPAAVSYLEQAVAAGLTKSWLQLPWFSVLAEYPQFIKLL